MYFAASCICFVSVDQLIKRTVSDFFSAMLYKVSFDSFLFQSIWERVSIGKRHTPERSQRIKMGRPWEEGHHQCHC